MGRKRKNNISRGGKSIVSGNIKGTDKMILIQNQIENDITLNDLRCAIRGYKAFTALISQADSADPTIDTILQNDFNEIPTFAIAGTGRYTISFTEYDQSKAVGFLGQVPQTNTSAANMGEVVVAASSFQIRTYGLSSSAVIAFENSNLSSTFIELRIYQ